MCTLETLSTELDGNTRMGESIESIREFEKNEFSKDLQMVNNKITSWQILVTIREPQ